MKSTISRILLVACLCTLCFVAGAQPQSVSPPGIAADRWLPITPTLGFVITGGGTPGMPPSSAVSTVTGYFMAVKDGKWIRLDVEPPPARPSDAR